MMSAASSSSNQLGDLPRIECPRCHIKVIKTKSRKDDVYYKCPNHFKMERSTCPYYWYEQPYLEYLLSNHPKLLNPAAAATPDATADEVESVAEEVNGDLKLQMCQLKLELYEMEGKLGEVMQEIKEAKQEIKEEIAKGNKAAPVFSCHIS